MIPSSACPPWRADQPGHAGKHGDQGRQLHHIVGHHRRGRKEIVPVLRELGADPEVLIGEAGLDPGLFADENNIIPYAALGRIFAIGAERTQCPHLGLLVGQLRR